MAGGRRGGRTGGIFNLGTGGPRRANDVVLLGGDLLGLTRGLVVDVEDGRGFADLYLAPGATSSIFFTMAEMLNWLLYFINPSLDFAASTCSSTKDLWAETSA